MKTQENQEYETQFSSYEICMHRSINQKKVYAIFFQKILGRQFIPLTVTNV